MRAPRLLRKGRGRGGEKSNFFCNPSVTRGPGMPPSHLSFFIGHSSFEQSVAVCRSQSIYPVVVRLQRKRIPALDGENRPILAETLEHQSLEGERQRVLLYL